MSHLGDLSRCDLLAEDLGERSIDALHARRQGHVAALDGHDLVARLGRHLRDAVAHETETWGGEGAVR